MSHSTVRPLRWAVAGTGQISHTVVPDIQLCEATEVVAVWSRDYEKAERFAADHGITQPYDDYTRLLQNTSIDVIYLATPIATHYDLTRQAILAGKHVLVEKPMATSAQEVSELFSLAEENGVFLMEAMWMKFNPAFRLLMETIPERIGASQSLRAGFGFPFPEDGSSKWDITRSGGALLDQAIYPVTFAHTVLGEPSGVYARGRLRSDGLDLGEHFTLEYDDGRFAQCSSSITGFDDPSASVSGPGGWIHVNAPFWATTAFSVHAAGTPEKLFTNPDRITEKSEGNGYVPMIRAVRQAVSDGKTQHQIHPQEDTEAVFRTLDAIRAQILNPAPAHLIPRANAE